MQTSLRTGRIDCVEAGLCDLQQGLELLAKSQDPADAVSNASVEKWFLIYSVLLRLHKGKSKEATPLLSRLHLLLDRDHVPADQDELTMPAGSSLRFQDAGTEPLDQEAWQDKKLPYLVAYHVSGLVHHNHDPEKALLFYREGLAAVLQELAPGTAQSADLQQLERTLYRTPVLVELATNLALRIFELHLTKGEFVAAIGVGVGCSDGSNCARPPTGHCRIPGCFRRWSDTLCCTGHFCTSPWE